MIQQAVLLAAGRGSRLGQLTVTRPKPMLPIVGRPIMARVIAEMQLAGITDFIIIVNAIPNAITDYFSTWAGIQFVEQPQALGTADALAQATAYLQGDFIVASTDNLVDADDIRGLIAAHTTYQDTLTLSLVPATRQEIKASASIVLAGRHVQAIEEKPQNPEDSLAAILLYACSHEFLSTVEQVGFSARGEKELPAAVQMLLAKGKRVGSHRINSRLHLTHPRDLYTINCDYLRRAGLTHFVEEGAQIGQNVILGENVIIEAGVIVGDNARISRSLLLNGATIPAGAIITDKLIGADTTQTI
jgi:UDP-N-acetylglucosamine diphosphorylase / glucose-1-phosphate thymidylyltransferase / UDP-N-acetylgalactosamine diphosphorylase / glucosamine-1-phosphate N-acetyltransferase / galactosamine-1-phosphate N-acetyltransferase